MSSHGTKLLPLLAGGAVVMAAAWATACCDRQQQPAGVTVQMVQRVPGEIRWQLPPPTPMRATWYGERYAGRPTASGILYDPDAMVAAHRSLPLGAVLAVTANGRSVRVRIIDRSHQPEHLLDLSRAAFAALAPLERGVVAVRVRVLEVWP